MSDSDVPSRAPTSPVAREHLEAAADWFARLRDGEADESVRRDWRLWLRQHRDHQAAWDFVTSVGRRFAPLQAEGDSEVASSVLQARRKRRTSRRQVLTGLAGAAGFGLLGLAAYRFTPLPASIVAWQADEHSAIGEIRDLALADGTRLWLSSASAIDRAAGGGTQRIDLLQGEIFVATDVDSGDGDSEDAPHPLQVVTEHGEMRPLGTQFAVRRQGDATLLAVFDGKVELRTAASAERRQISAGEQVAFTATQVAAVAAADPARQAWTRGVLLARDITLGELVGELARYQRGYLGVAPEVAELRVIGGFPLRDPDRALDMLADSLPIRIHRPLPWWTTIQPAG